MVSGNVLANDASGADTPKVFTAWDAAANMAEVGQLNTYGTLVQNANGTWSYTLDGAIDHSDAVPDAESFSVVVTDSDGDTDSATLDIAITDDGPEILTLADLVEFSERQVPLTTSPKPTGAPLPVA